MQMKQLQCANTLLSCQIACALVMESGLFIAGAQWQQFGLRVGRSGRNNVRSQGSKKLHDLFPPPSIP